MVQYNEELKNAEEMQEDKITAGYEKVKSVISVWIGLIITIIGMGVMFVVASLEGSKEIKASNIENSKLVNIWRNKNETEFPEELVDTILYKDREYYFIVDEYDEEMSIVKWHFSYDGGIDYVFSDYKFYVLTGISMMISLYVGYINYISRLRKVMESLSFMRTQAWYQKQKQQAQKNADLLPDFCIYKNEQAYEIAKRDIIEEAGLHYDAYMAGKYDNVFLEKWQVKILKKIGKIKIDRLHAPDLLQENNKIGKKHVQMLPTGQAEHQKNFLIYGGVQRLITSALSGLVIAFGVVLGNWFLGLMYGLTILLSAFSANIIATDFGLSTLRNRFISKADYLIEFNLMKDYFIKQKEARKIEAVKAEKPNEKPKEEPKKVEKKIETSLDYDFNLKTISHIV